MTSRIDVLPKAFIWRRLHSLAGIWLVLFLVEHLLTNSQAALLLGDNAQGFVRMVNLIHNLPYLGLIELTLIGIPFAIHIVWGIRYALTSKANSMKSDGSSPSLPYSKNRSYRWQRVTSWILVVLLIVHVVKFRFVEYPQKVQTIDQTGLHTLYYVTVSKDPGIATVADRLGVSLYDSNQTKKLSLSSPLDAHLDPVAQQHAEMTNQFVSKLQAVSLKPNELIALAPTFGTATLFSVRDTFKNPFWVAIYTVFVLSACFHACNGLWTSMLTWGWVIKASAQNRARKVTWILMGALSFLGLCAVWGTYFINLKR